MITVVLTAAEMQLLQKPTVGQGGWQSLNRRLRDGVDLVSGALLISDEDLKRIRRYAFKYKNGGFQGRLKAVFSRVLGPIFSGPM